ncbi:hypothetical protein HYV43_02865 [Candidatus Micrarchaeota archaeon]|nr:hypothetical protein [Candidatus Micrarchaeota archaeon]
MQFYFGTKDSHDFAKHLMNKLKDDPTWGATINRNITWHSDRLVAHAKDLHATELVKLTNAELWLHYAEHVRRHSTLYEWGWLPNAVDMFHPEFTTYLKAVLRGQAQDEEEVNTWFVTLTTSEKKTIANQEHEDLVKLALKIKADKPFAARFRDGPQNAMDHTPDHYRHIFQAIFEKYRHLKFMYHGHAGTLLDVYAALQPLVQGRKSLDKELERIEKLPQNARRAKDQRLKELCLSKKQAQLFDVFAEFMYTKWYRRNAQILALFHLEPLLQEIASRIGVSLQNVRTMLSSEVRDALQDPAKHGGAQLKKKLDERFAYFAYYAENGKEQIFTGNDAEKLEKAATAVTIDRNVKELVGQTACLGKAIGAARIIMGPKDLHKMKKGDIMVAIATDPDVVPGMKIAAAIVTEQGGVTSHAAIVSRELGVPCIIGTKIATKWLKDGDRVEVDATKGIVRKL